MSDLDFGDSDEEALTVLKIFAQRANQDLYNHGRDGLLTRFNNLATVIVTQEQEREKQHRSNRNRLNLIIALLAMIAGYIAIIVTVHVSGKPIAAFHSNLPPTYASTR